MSTVNVYFSHGTKSEQYLVEDLIIESLKIYGNEVYYIPRTLVNKDVILGEDRLSRFTDYFPIEMYFENVDSFGGQGQFLQKFGLMIDQSATLVVARRRWEQMVGRYGVTTLPQRPNEGDLIYFPLSKGLFEIKFVKHQDPFYQLGKLYVYKLQVELFQYSSERIDTGIVEVDVFESLHSYTTDVTRSGAGGVSVINVVNGGSGYTTASVTIQSAVGSGATAVPVITNGVITRIDVTNPGKGYGSSSVAVVITGNGTGAVASAIVTVDIDKVESYGDNNSFRNQGDSFVFNENNPFGDV